MTTEEAFDFAYETPWTPISTESLYNFHETYFYYDDEGNMFDQDKNPITEDMVLRKVQGASDPEFDEWIELVDITINDELSDREDMNNYIYGDDIEY